jgi:4,5-DOPA dioxygenase extradiol
VIPSLFVSHGAPSLVLEDHSYSRFLKALALEFPTPKAIVLFSAHWESTVQSISGSKIYDTIYDFSGFPDQLYQMKYPAPGHVQFAERILSKFEEHGITSRIDTSRGLDHGAWVILKLLYPKADIPVIELSVNPKLSNAQQYKIGRILSPLRQEDILIIGSGVTVHNLRTLKFDSSKAFGWAVAFDDWLKDQIEAWNLDALFQYETLAPNAKQAVPTQEHFAPLLIAMGAGDKTKSAKCLHQSYQFGSISLSCWTF